MSGHFTMNTAFGKTWGDNEHMRIIRIGIGVSTECTGLINTFFFGVSTTMFCRVFGFGPFN
jgi:hypothetical protein